MLDDVKIYYNKRSGRYHLIHVDDNGNIIGDLGALNDPQNISKSRIADQLSLVSPELEVGPAIDPNIFGRLALHIDPFDPTKYNEASAVILPGSSTTGSGGTTTAYFAAANANGFNGGDGAGGYTTREKISIAFWVRQEDNFGDSTIIAKQPTSRGTPAGLPWAINTGPVQGRGLAVWMDNSGTNYRIYTDNAVLTLNKWHHVVITINLNSTDYPTAADRTTIYVDATEITAKTEVNTPPSAFPNTSSALEIGRRFENSHRDFGGAIAHVCVFSEELTSGDVTALYNAGIPLKYTDAAFVTAGLDDFCEAYWPFNQRTNDAYDISGNDRHQVRNGTHDYLNFIDQITDKGPYALQFDFPWPQTGAITKATGINGRDSFHHAVVTSVAQYGRALYEQGTFPGYNTFTFICAFNNGTTNGVEKNAFTFSNSGLGSFKFYATMQIATSSSNIHAFRVNNQVTQSKDGNVYELLPGTGLTLGKSYIVGFNSYGTTDAAYSWFRNGVSLGITNTASIKGLTNVPERNNAGIFGIPRPVSPTGSGGNWDLGTILVFSPALDDVNFGLAMKYVNNLYNGIY